MLNRRLPCWQYRVHCVHTVLPTARTKMAANPPQAFYTTKIIKSPPDICRHSRAFARARSGELSLNAQ